jgi:threonine dehydrogenase-like Zn-dependent dehydrogenase
MLALELYRSKTRYVAARAVGGRMPGVLAGPAAPLRLVNRGEPRLPASGWVRVRPLLSGICGSDLATLSGQSSLYFTPLVSMPFTPGHEVVGELLDDIVADGDRPGLDAGTRVVLDPVLSCEPRGLERCAACAAGATSRCAHITVGHVAPGLQTGFCADTGGGWSDALVAHRSQLHAVPDALPDDQAVLVEPLACAVHAVRRADILPGEHVALVGSGTVGLLTLLAVRALTQAGRVTVVAKHPRQRELAEVLGATDVVTPDGAATALRRATRSFLLRPERGQDYLLGGVDVAFDCAGATASIDMALRSTRAGGRVVLAGMPSGAVDLTPLWFRELTLVGAYASSNGTAAGAADGAGPDARDGHAGRRGDFATAIELATRGDLAGFVGATYPLAQWREALDHAFAAGRLGTLKIAFDPTTPETG